MKKIFTLLSIFMLVVTVSAQTAGILTVTTTTSSPGATGYDPENVLAIWVQNSNGVLVNTLLYNTNNSHSSAVDLTAWYSLITGGWANRKVATTVDAVTSATNSSYGPKSCSWGKSTNISTVPDGVYTVKMEILCSPVALGSTGHKMVAYTFTKGRANSTGTLSGSAASSFSNVSIQWTPNFTAINDVKLENLYAVYPNPTKSDIYVNGSDIKGIEIFSLTGKSILKTNQQKINLSLLSPGLYIAEITTEKGTFLKKIIKE